MGVLQEKDWQVCNLILAKKLETLKVPQNSLWYWVDCNADRSYGIYEQYMLGWESTGFNWHSAFTVAELGNLLRQQNPFWMPYRDMTNTFFIVPLSNEHENTEANARAKMLIYLIEKER